MSCDNILLKLPVCTQELYTHKHTHAPQKVDMDYFANRQIFGSSLLLLLEEPYAMQCYISQSKAKGTS